jgi:hypothetical protein
MQLRTLDLWELRSLGRQWTYICTESMFYPALQLLENYWGITSWCSAGCSLIVTYRDGTSFYFLQPPHQIPRRGTPAAELIFATCIKNFQALLPALLQYPRRNNRSAIIHTMSLSNKLSITDTDLKGKRVLIRVSPPGPDPRFNG